MNFNSINWSSPWTWATGGLLVIALGTGINQLNNNTNTAKSQTNSTPGAGTKAASTKSANTKDASPIKATPITQAPPETPYQAPIASYAVKPYTPDQFPKTFATYGSRMGELQAYREKAAKVASQNRSCDEVVMAEISTTRGGPGNMNFWVDCENGTRFRFSEAELDSSTVVAISEADKTISEAAAEKRCKQMIMASATHPSTVRIYPLQKAFSTFAQTGAADYRQGFEAKNSFGTKLKFTARCNFQSDGRGEITIKEQEG